MRNRNQTRLRAIQLVCWIGAAADAFWTLVLLHPPLYGTVTNRPDLQGELVLRLSLGIGAVLMAGWTVLLLWAAQAPVSRRAVLLFTAFPILTGLTLLALIGCLTGNPANSWIVAKCLLLGIAMLWAFRLAGSLAKGGGGEYVH